MFRLTWILFALFSLILPILSAPVPTPEDMELENRAAAATHSGRVRVFSSPFVHDADLSAHRVLGTNLASVAAVK
jgi:hypothetical protein